MDSEGSSSADRSRSAHSPTLKFRGFDSSRLSPATGINLIYYRVLSLYSIPEPIYGGQVLVIFFS